MQTVVPENTQRETCCATTQTTSKASESTVTAVTADGFDPGMFPLVLVVALATALGLKVVGHAMASIAGVVKSVMETGLAALAMLAVLALAMVLAITYVTP